jgi:hypothetical protein
MARRHREPSEIIIVSWWCVHMTYTWTHAPAASSPSQGCCGDDDAVRRGFSLYVGFWRPDVCVGRIFDSDGKMSMFALNLHCVTRWVRKFCSIRDTRSGFHATCASSHVSSLCVWGFFDHLVACWLQYTHSMRAWSLSVCKIFMIYDAPCTRIKILAV